MLNSELKTKKEFVEELGKTLSRVQKNIASMEYLILYNKLYECPVEYLIINYVGGAKTVRCCTGNSCSAIFEEVAKYLNHGYYDEVEYLEDLLKNPNYEVING